MRVVWASPHPWQSDLRLSGHHIAEAAATHGDDVLFISGPVCATHFLKLWDRRVRNRLADFRVSPHSPIENLSVVHPFSLLPVHQKQPFDTAYGFRNWHRWTVPNLRKKIVELGYDTPDMLVMDHPFYSGLESLLQPQKTVVRILDKLEGFQNTPQSLLAMMPKIVSKADLTVVAAKSLKSYAEDLGAKNLKFLPHGIDHALFSQPNLIEPADLRGIQRPRIIYMGAIADWFDKAGIEKVAKRSPNLSFVLVGPISTNIDQLRVLDNVHILGPKPYRSVPAYLRYSDIGIIAFDMVKFAELTRHIHPLKYYEYQAAGLPVVAPRMPELEKVAGEKFFYDRGEMMNAISLALEVGVTDTTNHQYFGESWEDRYLELREAVLAMSISC